MKSLTTLQKFVTIIHRTYKKNFAVITVKCLIYMFQTLYATALVSGVIWCLERPNARMAWLGILSLAVAGVVIACLKRLVDHSYEVHKERMKEALDHSIFDKISKMPYKYLEDPHYLDLVNQAKFCIKEEDCIDSIFRRGFDFLQNIALPGVRLYEECGVDMAAAVAFTGDRRAVQLEGVQNIEFLFVHNTCSLWVVRVYFSQSGGR